MEDIIVEQQAIKNYKNSKPWPDNDEWHKYTYTILKKYVQDWLIRNTTARMLILNAGCGNTTYNTPAEIIYMDIVEDYISSFKQYIVGSVEKIPLEDHSIDGIICVGSVLNYVDAQKTISEFSRILKPQGFLILEFERTKSAEFLFTPEYKKTIFLKRYHYNGQEHFLWMYNERFIIQLLEYYNLKLKTKYRFHCISSLLYRIGFQEKNIAKYSKWDSFLQIFSYPIAHNVILNLTKN